MLGPATTCWDVGLGIVGVWFVMWLACVPRCCARVRCECVCAVHVCTYLFVFWVLSPCCILRPHTPAPHVSTLIWWSASTPHTCTPHKHACVHKTCKYTRAYPPPPHETHGTISHSYLHNIPPHTQNTNALSTLRHPHSADEGRGWPRPREEDAEVTGLAISARCDSHPCS